MAKVHTIRMISEIKNATGTRTMPRAPVARGAYAFQPPVPKSSVPHGKFYNKSEYLPGAVPGASTNAEMLPDFKAIKQMTSKMRKDRIHDEKAETKLQKEKERELKRQLKILRDQRVQSGLFYKFHNLLNRQTMDMLASMGGLSYKLYHGLRFLASAGKQWEMGQTPDFISSMGGDKLFQSTFGKLSPKTGAAVTANGVSSGAVKGVSTEASAAAMGGGAAGIGAALGIGAVVGILVVVALLLKKMLENSQVAQALMAAVDMTLGSILDFSLMGYILLQDMWDVIGGAEDLAEDIHDWKTDFFLKLAEAVGTAFFKILELDMIMIKTALSGILSVAEVLGTGFFAILEIDRKILEFVIGPFMEGLRVIGRALDPKSFAATPFASLFSGKLDLSKFEFENPFSPTKMFNFVEGVAEQLDLSKLFALNGKFPGMDLFDNLPGSETFKKWDFKVSDIMDITGKLTLTDLMDTVNKVSLSIKDLVTIDAADKLKFTDLIDAESVTNFFTQAGEQAKSYLPG